MTKSDIAGRPEKKEVTNEEYAELIAHHNERQPTHKPAYYPGIGNTDEKKEEQPVEPKTRRTNQKKVNIDEKECTGNSGM